MTKTKQDQNAKPAAVELRDDALDQAAGGAIDSHLILKDIKGESKVFSTPGTGVLKAT